jgi:hypothetical protein
MRCAALLFNLETLPNRKKPGTFNNFMTFVDTDSGESYRTFVDEVIASEFVKMKPVDLVLSFSMGDFNGKPQLNIRILSMVDHKPAASEAEAKPTDKPASLFPGSKTGTNG